MSASHFLKLSATNNSARTVLKRLSPTCTRTVLSNCPVKHCRPGAISLGIDGSKTGGGFEGPSEQGRRRVSRGTLMCLRAGRVLTNRGLRLVLSPVLSRSAAAWEVLLPLFPPRPPLGRFLVKRRHSTYCIDFFSSLATR